LEDVREDLVGLLVEQPPANTREGGMLRAGADDELDQQRPGWTWLTSPGPART